MLFCIPWLHYHNITNPTILGVEEEEEEEEEL